MANWLSYTHGAVDAAPDFTQAHKNRISEAVEDIAEALGDTSPAGADASVRARLDRMERAIGQIGHRAVRAFNNATNPASKVDVTWSFLAIEGYATTNFTGTCDLTVTAAANGRDSATSLAAAWYYLWAIYNPASSTAALLFSTSSTAPTLPSGYTAKRYLGAWRNTSTSAALRWQHQEGDEMLVTGDDPPTNWRVVSAITITTSWQTPTVTSFLPPVTRCAYLTGHMNAPGGSTSGPTLSIRTKGATGGGCAIATNKADAFAVYGRSVWVPLNASQQFEWRTEATVTSMTANVDVLGWKEPL